jgi:isoquinoline 1-oxidoreductase subunit beta
MKTEQFTNHAIIQNVSRRDVLKGVVTTGSLVLAAQFVPGIASADENQYNTGAGGMPGGVVWDPHVYVAIAADGTVTIVSHRSEMGTGSRTSLPMVVADEMEADWSKVKIVQAPGDEPKYGNQDTDGSRSMRHFIQPMRSCGAAARLMLERAAALQWNCSDTDVRAEMHKVVHIPSGKTLGYGELAAAASALKTPRAGDVTLKKPAQFRYIGKGNVPIYDLHDITTGKATYGQDVIVPGMKFAVVARPPVVGGEVVSFDEAAAMKVPGVIKIVKIPATKAPAKFGPLGGVAVIAENTWSALQARSKLNVKWNDGPNGQYDSDAFKKQMQAIARAPGKVERNEGDFDAAIKTAAKVIEHEYYVPHFSHATMEPPAAVAKVADGKAEIWACVQSPGGTRGDVANTLGIDQKNVTVNVTLLGGGFGRKSKCDFALEAAILSKAMGGTPIKVVWTREDDIQHAFYHSVSLQHVTAGLDKDGKVIAWRQRSVSPSLMSNFMPDPKRESALELGLGLIDTPFNVPNLRLETGEAVAHTRIGWFRSVNNIPHAFAMQSMVAELAAELGKDQKEYLLQMIGPARIVDPRKTVTSELWNYGDPFDTYPIDTGRMRKVVELAAEKAGWGRKMEKGHGLGIAVQRSFLSYVATVVEVAVDAKGNVSVPRVDTAIDCGFHVNPERIASQMEGAAVMGLSIAKYSQITFKNGRVQQSNFNDYQVLRIGEGAMDVRTHIVPHGVEVPSSGVGEPGVPPFAPAFTNAVFAATGKRIRDLPLGNQLSV